MQARDPMAANTRAAYLADQWRHQEPQEARRDGPTARKRKGDFVADEPVKPRRRQQDELRALHHDVEDLERRLADARRAAKAGERRREKDAASRAARRMRGFLDKCRAQAKMRPSACGLGLGLDANMQCHGRMPYEPAVDAPVFTRLEQNVSSQYASLAQIFHDAGLGPDKTDLYDAQVMPGGALGAYVRFATAKVAPFELDAVSGAMWRSAEKSSILDASALTPTTSAGTTVYLKRECLLQNDPESGEQGVPILLRCVCRRIVEPQRIVLLWEGTGDWPRDYIQRNPSSVPIRERGWCVVRAFQDPSKLGRKSALPLSLFQSCVLMTPGMSSDMAMDRPEHLQMLADVVIPSYRKILDMREQMLENSILDEMLDRRTRPTTATAGAQ